MKMATRSGSLFQSQFAIGLLLVTCQQLCLSVEIASTSVIAFGSCNRQNKPQSHWDIIKATNPDLFLWTGDSVYAKNNSLNGLEAAFKNLTDNVLYQNFKSNVLVDGIWDDHDMGVNDGGRHVTLRKERQEMFLNYISDNSSPHSSSIHNITENDTQKGSETGGIIDLNRMHTSYSPAADGLNTADTENTQGDFSNSKSRPERQDGLYKIIDRKFGTYGPYVRFILLDTRSHRDNHYIKSVGEIKFPLTPLVAAFIRATYSVLGFGREHKGDMLGEIQWKWLEKSLSESTADFHVIISSIQILTSNPVVESWGHFPVEKKRLFDLLKKLDPPGLFFLSGDVHHGEISGAKVIREKSVGEKNKGLEGGIGDNYVMHSVSGGGDGGVENGGGGDGDKGKHTQNKVKDEKEEHEQEQEDGNDVWVEVTSSGLTHTCGDGLFNKILCPNMLRLFSNHRLPYTIAPSPSQSQSPTLTPLSDPFKSTNTNKIKKENFFIGKNFGLISDVSTEKTFALNVSVVGIDSQKVELSYVVRSFRHNCNSNADENGNRIANTEGGIQTGREGGGGKETGTRSGREARIDGGAETSRETGGRGGMEEESSINRRTCTPMPIREVVTPDFPLCFPKSVSGCFTTFNIVFFILLVQCFFLLRPLTFKR